MWLGVGNTVGRNDSIHHRLQIRESTISISHLLVIGTGYDGNFHTFLTEFLHEIHNTRDVVEMHSSLEIEQFFGNLGLNAFRTQEVLTINLCQSLPLDMMTEVGNLRMILLSFFIPKEGILRFCIDHHTIEIEEGSNVFFLVHRLRK